MDQDKQIEQLVLTCIDTAKGMLKEYEMVIPFGIRSFNDSEDLKMNCPGDKNPDADWNEQINLVVNELKEFVSKENIFATVLVTELSSEGESGIGLQVETDMSSVLFVYPYKREGDEWIVDEPVQTDQLLASVFANNQ
ncbi:MAG: hypothetical protein QM500_19715 [Methylococcales bacterium]